jgi:lipopolysaccharide export system protein LptA
MTRHRPTWLLAGLLAAAVPAALAERADRDKPTVIEADRGSANELQQTNIWTGKVVLTKGTLRITGERLELKQTASGYRTAVVTGAAGGVATFRQRRDPTRPGIEEVVEGTAERIEWDERDENVRFINRAVWKRLENGTLRDEITGTQISYDGATGTYTVASNPGASDRVRAVIAPRSSSETPAPPTTAGAPLKPATQLEPRKP